MKRQNMIEMLISPSRDFGFVSHTMPTSKSHPVPAFYDANEPLLLSMLSSQTEICYQPKTPVHVSAMEEIVISQLPMAVLLTTNTRSTTKMVCMSTPGTSSRQPLERSSPPQSFREKEQRNLSLSLKAIEQGLTHPRQWTQVCHPSTKSKKVTEIESLNQVVRSGGRGGVATIGRINWAGEKMAAKN